MIKGNKKWLLIISLPIFTFYIFLAPRPIPEETVLKPLWVTSLELNNPLVLDDYTSQGSSGLLPFTLGNRFGYVADDGRFSINKVRDAYISLSENYWAEYETLPASIQVFGPTGESLLAINDPKGYPLFLDNRIFIIGNEQNSISLLGNMGEALWTFDFHSPITCVDAANGFLMAGTLDGVMVLLNSGGNPVFPPFEPGGSRLSLILGCAISQDASRLALISGIDNQRFLLLERGGDTYRVVYHEFLGSGFRRPVHITFADNDTKVVFERVGGLGIYTINSRASNSISLDGEIVILDNSGDERFLFLVTSTGVSEKQLITIKFPATVINVASFKSENAFMARRDSRLYIGGDLTMASFEMERR